MSKLDIFASNKQFINAWSSFASVCPKGEVLEANELVITWSGTDNFVRIQVGKRGISSGIVK